MTLIACLRLILLSYFALHLSCSTLSELSKHNAKLCLHTIYRSGITKSASALFKKVLNGCICTKISVAKLMKESI